MKFRVNDSRVTGTFMQENYTQTIVSDALSITLKVIVDVSKAAPGVIARTIPLNDLYFYDIVDYELKSATLFGEEINVDTVDQVWDKMFKETWKSVQKKVGNTIRDHFNNKESAILRRSVDWLHEVMAEYLFIIRDNCSWHGYLRILEDEESTYPWNLRLIAQHLGYVVGSCKEGDHRVTKIHMDRHQYGVLTQKSRNLI